jgi:hypothetical protein
MKHCLESRIILYYILLNIQYTEKSFKYNFQVSNFMAYNTSLRYRIVEKMEALRTYIRVKWKGVYVESLSTKIKLTKQISI